MSTVNQKDLHQKNLKQKLNSDYGVEMKALERQNIEQYPSVNKPRNREKLTTKQQLLIYFCEKWFYLNVIR